MRFNQKELAYIASRSHIPFDKEGVLWLKEKEGYFWQRSDGTWERISSCFSVSTKADVRSCAESVRRGLHEIGLAFQSAEIKRMYLSWFVLPVCLSVLEIHLGTCLLKWISSDFIYFFSLAKRTIPFDTTMDPKKIFKSKEDLNSWLLGYQKLCVWDFFE